MMALTNQGRLYIVAAGNKVLYNDSIEKKIQECYEEGESLFKLCQNDAKCIEDMTGIRGQAYTSKLEELKDNETAQLN